MGVVYAPESEYAKERRKWEAVHTQFGAPGKPYVYLEYPTRMYKAVRKDLRIDMEGQTARDEHEQRNLESRGFVVGGQAAAMAALEREQTEHGKLAAEINHDIRHMSEQARAEAEAFQMDNSAVHQPVIPETPLPAKNRKVELAK